MLPAEIYACLLVLTAMKISDWDFVGRRPRHVAVSVVDVERTARAGPARFAAELVDFSRQGARLRTEVLLADDEAIKIFLPKASTGIDVAFPGAVRWRAEEEASRWLYGCQFKDEVPLETLGELFLAGILSDQPPPPKANQSKSYSQVP
jgi:hypothetical protein